MQQKIGARFFFSVYRSLSSSTRIAQVEFNCCRLEISLIPVTTAYRVNPMLIHRV